MDNYFIVGGSLLQLDFIKTVKKNGYKAHVIDYDPTCPGAREADYFHCVSIDDKESILELAIKHQAVGIHTVATEQGNVTACYVAEKLGLFGNSYEVALDTTDKYRMKKVLSLNGLSTPHSRPVKHFSEIEALDLSYPVIVKASDRSAGRGVSLASTFDELRIAFEDALAESFSKVVLVEDYFVGQQFSVETLSSNGQHEVVAITKMGFTGPPDFVETEHLLPAPISSELERSITDYAIKALDAFGIEWGAAHIELRVDESHCIKMIEIASRMGGWRNWMIESALGINYLQLILDSSLGKNTSIKREKFGVTAVVRNIVDTKGYSKYLDSLEYEEEIVVDHVKSGSPESQASNLINSHGFYVLVKEAY